MFLSSKLCLLIALLLGWLLMDITFHAVPQATVCCSAFWNERLCDAPLKLVQHGIIHLLWRCQRGAAASPRLPVTMGLQGDALSGTSQRCTLYSTTEIGTTFTLHIHLRQLNHSGSYFRSYFKVLPPCTYPVSTPKICHRNISWGQKNNTVQGQWILHTKTGTRTSLRASCCFWVNLCYMNT